MTNKEIIDKLVIKYPQYTIDDYNYWEVKGLTATYWGYDSVAGWSEPLFTVDVSTL